MSVRGSAWRRVRGRGPQSGGLRRRQVGAVTPAEGRQYPRRERRLGLLAGVAAVLALAAAAGCGLSEAAPPAPRDPHGPRDLAAYIRHLEDPARDAYQRPGEVVRTLALSRAALVADLGCGPGYFTRRLARAVPNGLVFAIDIEPRQLDRLREHLRADGLRNVIPVLAARDDPYLPPGRLDLILIVDTYHHFDDRPAYLRRLARGLKPGGRLAIIDYFKRDLPVGPPVGHKIARDQVRREVEAAGFSLLAAPAFLPYQYFLIFAAPEA